MDIAGSAASQIQDTTSNTDYCHSGTARETGGEDADMVSIHQQGESCVGVCMYMCTCFTVDREIFVVKINNFIVSTSHKYYLYKRTCVYGKGRQP